MDSRFINYLKRAIDENRCLFDLVPIENVFVPVGIARIIEQIGIDVIYGSYYNKNVTDKVTGLHSLCNDLTENAKVEIGSYVFLLAATAINTEITHTLTEKDFTIDYSYTVNGLNMYIRLKMHITATYYYYCVTSLEFVLKIIVSLTFSNY